MFGWKKDLSVINVYNQINDFDIFSYYIGEEVEIGKAFNHPLREDKNPSFAIYRKGNNLRWKDFSTGEGGSVFDFVRQKFDVTFYEALCIINADFNLNLEGRKINKTAITAPIKYNFDIKSVAENKDIRVRFCKATPKHYLYWKQYGISKETLIKYNVRCINGFKINDLIIIPYSIAFAYCFGNYKYKILQPEGDYKWISNSSANIIQGLDQLQKSNYTIITSSLKDVMVLHEMGYTAVAPQSENTIIDVSCLKTKNILLYYNNDEAGIKASKAHSVLYKCKYVVNPENYAKDPSDLVKTLGFDKAKQVVDNLLKQWFDSIME
jgi:DNA primase